MHSSCNFPTVFRATGASAAQKATPQARRFPSISRIFRLAQYNRRIKQFPAVTSNQTIDVLPQELLAEILLLTLPDISIRKLLDSKRILITPNTWHHPNHVRFVVSSVCRRWNAVLASCPSAWTTLVLDVNTSKAADMVKQYMELSKPYLLDIYVCPSKWNWTDDAISMNHLFRSEVARIQTYCEIGVENEKRNSFHFNGLYVMDVFRECKYAAPNLRNLALIGSGAGGLRFSGIKWDCPNLEYVALYPRFADCSFIRPEVIKELDLALDTMTPLVSLDCLRKCPNLHTLRLIHPSKPSYFYLHRYGPAFLGDSSEILLPNLKELQFSGRLIILFQFFQAILTPALETLVFRGVKDYPRNRESFKAADILKRHPLPNLLTLRIQGVHDLTTKDANNLTGWDFIQVLEIHDCMWIDSFIRRLAVMANGKPLLLPDLRSLKVSSCEFVSFKAVCKTVFYRLETLERVSYNKRYHPRLEFSRPPGKIFSNSLRRRIAKGAGIKNI